jgi:hypothetical protein
MWNEMPIGTYILKEITGQFEINPNPSFVILPVKTLMQGVVKENGK